MSSLFFCVGNPDSGFPDHDKTRGEISIKSKSRILITLPRSLMYIACVKEVTVSRVFTEWKTVRCQVFGNTRIFTRL